MGTLSVGMGTFCCTQTTLTSICTNSKEKAHRKCMLEVLQELTIWEGIFTLCKQGASASSQPWSGVGRHSPKSLLATRAKLTQSQSKLQSHLPWKTSRTFTLGGKVAQNPRQTCNLSSKNTPTSKHWFSSLYKPKEHPPPPNIGSLVFTNH